MGVPLRVGLFISIFFFVPQKMIYIAIPNASVNSLVLCFVSIFFVFLGFIYYIDQLKMEEKNEALNKNEEIKVVIENDGKKTELTENFIYVHYISSEKSESKTFALSVCFLIDLLEKEFTRDGVVSGKMSLKAR